MVILNATARKTRLLRMPSPSTGPHEEDPRRSASSLFEGVRAVSRQGSEEFELAAREGHTGEDSGQDGQARAERLRSGGRAGDVVERRPVHGLCSAVFGPRMYLVFTGSMYLLISGVRVLHRVFGPGQRVSKARARRDRVKFLIMSASPTRATG